MGGANLSKEIEQLARRDPPVVELNVSSRKIKALPDTVVQLTALKRLNASNNSIKTVTPQIDQLKNLIQLVLANNQITILPESISNCPALDELNLSVNRIADLPRGFGAFAKLRVLDLSYNEIVELPTQFGLLNHLVEFRASFNKIKRLPVEIGRLENLQDVKISNNYIRDLPAEMGNCKSLRTIDLSCNEIRVLCPDALKMDPLERIDLSNNRDLNQAIAAAARRGQESLIDYMRSSEYAALYRDVRQDGADSDEGGKKKNFRSLIVNMRPASSEAVAVRSIGIDALERQVLLFDTAAGATVDELEDNPFQYPSRKVEDCFFSALQATKKNAYAYDAQIRLVFGERSRFQRTIDSQSVTSPVIPASPSTATPGIANSSNAVLRRLAALKAKNVGQSIPNTSPASSPPKVSDDTRVNKIDEPDGAALTSVPSAAPAPSATREERPMQLKTSSSKPDLPDVVITNSQTSALNSSGESNEESLRSQEDVVVPSQSSEPSEATTPEPRSMSESVPSEMPSKFQSKSTPSSPQQQQSTPSPVRRGTSDDESDDENNIAIEDPTERRRLSAAKLSKKKANSDLAPILGHRRETSRGPSTSEGGSESPMKRKQSDIIRNTINFMSPRAAGISGEVLVEKKKGKSTPLWKLKAQAQLNRSLSREQLRPLDAGTLTPGEYELLETKRKLLFDARFETRKVQAKIKYQRREQSVPVCSTCQTPVMPGEKFITHDDLKIHESCFFCIQCSAPLEGQPYVLVDDSFWDVVHWKEVQAATEEDQQKSLGLARQKLAKHRARIAFEYQIKKNDQIAAMEALEREKILKELDDELIKEIEHIRANKTSRMKSIVGYQPMERPQALQENLQLVLGTVDRAVDGDTLFSPKAKAAEDSEESNDSDSDRVHEASKVALSSLPSSPALAEALNGPSSEDASTSGLMTPKLSQSPLTARRNMSMSHGPRPKDNIAVSPRVLAALSRKTAAKQLEISPTPRSEGAANDAAPQSDSNPVALLDQRLAPKTPRKRSASFTSYMPSKLTKQSSSHTDESIEPIGVFHKSKTLNPSKRLINSAKPSPSPPLATAAGPNQVLLSPRSRLKSIKRNKSDENLQQNLTNGPEHGTKPLYALADVLRISATVPGPDTQAYHGIEPRASNPTLGLNRRPSMVHRADNFKTELVDSRVVIIATDIEAIINEITSRSVPEDDLIRNFLYIYPYLLQSTTLLKKLDKRWLYEAPKEASTKLKNDYSRWRLTIRYRVLSLIKRWLSEYSYYFANKKLHSAMKKFLLARVKPFNREWYEELSALLMVNVTPKLAARFQSPQTKAALKPKKKLLSARKPPASRSPMVLRANERIPLSARDPERSLEKLPSADSDDEDDTLDFTYFDPKAFAKQLTLHENAMISAIEPDELLGARWKRPDKAVKAPRVARMIDWFNHVTGDL